MGKAAEKKNVFLAYSSRRNTAWPIISGEKDTYQLNCVGIKC